jgi:hypothetical protein
MSFLLSDLQVNGFLQTEYGKNSLASVSLHETSCGSQGTLFFHDSDKELVHPSLILHLQVWGRQRHNKKVSCKTPSGKEWKVLHGKPGKAYNAT